MRLQARAGLTLPLWPFDLGRSLEIARLAEELGYTDIWTAETSGADGLAAAAAIGAVTQSVRIGCAVVPAYTRPAPLIAMGALAAHQASRGRFCLGIGASSPTIIERWMGLPFEAPLKRVAETVQVVKSALTGEKVKFSGETMSVNGFKLEAPPESPIPLYLAALGPRMMELAASEADGISLFLTTEAGVRLARERAPDLSLMARLPCCPDEPIEEVRGVARWMLAPYVSVPAYNRFLVAQGYEDDARAVATAWEAGDRAGALEAMSDRLIDDLVLMGPAEACKEKLESFREAGLETPVLMLFSQRGGDGTLAALERLAP
jgi:probable F420-dependent oxidoreductase